MAGNTRKKDIGIYIINQDGSRPTTMKMLGRATIGYLLSAIIFSGGYIIAAFTKRKVTLHDILFKTYVVHGRPENT